MHDCAFHLVDNILPHVAGEGKSTPAEYGMPCNVSLEVIEFIEEWLKVQVAPKG